MNEEKIRFVVATRESRKNFFNATPTGKTLNFYKSPLIELDLYDSNSESLSKLYNRSIYNAKNDPAILVFAHDDIILTDFYWMGQLVDALNCFDIVGVAGNKTRTSNQPCWFSGEPSNLSGVVGHGNSFPPLRLSVYGPSCQEVKILDGVFLACRSSLLSANKLKFDERFDFHFYDLDFCREAEQKGLKMGTWPISLVHESAGNYDSCQWITSKEIYFAKWGN